MDRGVVWSCSTEKLPFRLRSHVDIRCCDTERYGSEKRRCWYKNSKTGHGEAELRRERLRLHLGHVLWNIWIGQYQRLFPLISWHERDCKQKGQSLNGKGPVLVSPLGTSASRTVNELAWSVMDSSSSLTSRRLLCGASLDEQWGGWKELLFRVNYGPATILQLRI